MAKGRLNKPRAFALGLLCHMKKHLGIYLSEKRGTPLDAPPPIKIIDCRIINLPYYLAIMIVTRFSAFSAKGCTRAPLDFSVMRSEGILYFFVSILDTRKYGSCPHAGFYKSL